jgi:hypothetical protein
MIAATALALAGLSAPCRAQGAAPSAIQAPPPLDESLAFIGKLGEVLSLQVDGSKKLLDAKPLIDSMTTLAAVKAGAPRMRALMAEARAEVERADAMIAAIVAPPGLRLGTVEPAAMLAEVRGQNAKLIALLDDYEVFLRSAERGDRAAMAKVAARLVEGSFVLIDGNATMYRGRQAAIPASMSVHQALEVGIQLYRSESAVGRAWLAARLGDKAGSAARRAQLSDAADRARRASAEGRANLAREMAEFDRRVAGLDFKGDEAATIGRLRAALAGKEKLFAVGDELALVAAEAATVGDAALAAQPAPHLFNRLMPLEMKFQAALAEQAAVATGKAR